MSGEQCKRATPLQVFGSGFEVDEKVVNDTKRRIEITVDRHRLVFLRRPSASPSSWCASCGEQVAMLTPDEAATVANVSSRTIYRRVEAGEIHYTETPEGLVRVCANSIGK